METVDTIGRLERIAWDLREDVVKMIGVRKSHCGHLGRLVLALAEDQLTLCASRNAVRSAAIKDPDRDRFPTEQRAFGPDSIRRPHRNRRHCQEELSRVKTLDGVLQGHPDMERTWMEAVTGSLGREHVPSSSAWLSPPSIAGPRASMSSWATAGKTAEGQIWEINDSCGALRAEQHPPVSWTATASDLVPPRTFSIPRIETKWLSFGWNVLLPSMGDMAATSMPSTQLPEHGGADGGRRGIRSGARVSFAKGGGIHNGIMTQERGTIQRCCRSKQRAPFNVRSNCR